LNLGFMFRQMLKLNSIVLGSKKSAKMEERDEIR